MPNRLLTAHDVRALRRLRPRRFRRAVEKRVREEPELTEHTVRCATFLQGLAEFKFGPLPAYDPVPDYGIEPFDPPEGAFVVTMNV